MAYFLFSLYEGSTCVIVADSLLGKYLLNVAVYLHCLVVPSYQS